MNPRNSAPPGGGAGGRSDQGGTGSVPTLQPPGDIPVEATPRRVKVGRFTPNPPNTRRVTRPSRWGNPHRVGYCARCDDMHTAAQAVGKYAADLADGALAVTVADVRAELAGVNLACACDLDAPCHADVLLRIAAGGAR